MKTKISLVETRRPKSKAGHLRTACTRRLLPLLLLLTLPAGVQAEDYDYIITGIGTMHHEITITGYRGPGGAVTIPGRIKGMPVTSIGDDAFADCTLLTSVTIPNSVTNIGHMAFCRCTALTSVTIGNSVIRIGQLAFWDCTSLTAVYFQGNAPSLALAVFYGDHHATVYYLPGTTGWGSTFGDRPTSLWQPQVQTSDVSFGVRTNGFGFNINWASGMTVVVEACTNLANPVWCPLQTNTLTDCWCCFNDPHCTNYPARFYRVRSH